MANDDDRTLVHCLGATLDLPASTLSPEMLVALCQRFVHAADAAPTPLRTALALDAPKFAALREELVRIAAPGETAQAQGRRRLSVLRALDWFWTARDAGSSVRLPALEALSAKDRVALFEKVYAIESMVRALYRELLGDDLAQIRAHLAQRLGDRPLKEAVRRAGAGELLSGLEFFDLISLFVWPQEWPRSGRLYEKSALIALLKTKRESVESFLHDVRRIRNRVVHDKPLGAVHHRLMEAYYPILVEPIRAAFPALTTVDPRNWESPAEEVLGAYAQAVRRLEPELKSIRRTQLGGAVALGLLALLMVPVAGPKLLDLLDPARHQMADLAREPHRIGEFAAHACERGDVATLQRFAEQPALQGRLRSATDTPADDPHMLLVQLAAAQPDRLASCLPSLQRLGWNAAIPSRTSAENDFDPARNPLGPAGIAAGYRSYAAAAAAAQLPGPSEVNGSALLYAVWHGHLPLATALLAAGADAQQPLAAGQRPVSAYSEAQRLQRTDLVLLFDASAASR